MLRGKLYWVLKVTRISWDFFDFHSLIETLAATCVDCKQTKSIIFKNTHRYVHSTYTDFIHRQCLLMFHF